MNEERFILLYGFLGCDGLRETYAETTILKTHSVFDKAEIVVCAEDTVQHIIGDFCWSLELRKGKPDEAVQFIPSGWRKL